MAAVDLGMLYTDAPRRVSTDFELFAASSPILRA